MEPCKIYNNYMSQPLQFQSTLSKESLGSISSAFRKLLDRVASVPMRATVGQSSIKRGSNASLHNEQLLRKRRASVSLFHKRKNSYFSGNANEKPYSQNPMMKGNESDKLASSNNFVQATYKSVRCHSDPSISNTSSLYNKISVHNQLLITKTFLFEGTPSSSTCNASKNVLFKQSFRKPLSSFCKQADRTIGGNTFYQSKIKKGQTRKQFLKTAKNWQQEYDPSETFAGVRDFEPWETDKAQQLSFIDH